MYGLVVWNVAGSRWQMVQKSVSEYKRFEPVERGETEVQRDFRAGCTIVSCARLGAISDSLEEDVGDFMP